jgi:hypothetical protein
MIRETILRHVRDCMGSSTAQHSTCSSDRDGVFGNEVRVQAH